MSLTAVLPDFYRWLVNIITTDTILQSILTSPETAEVRVYEAQDSEGRPASGYVATWPENPRYPAVRFELLESPHTVGNGGRRFASHPLLQIEAIAPTESLAGDLETIAKRLNALLGQRAQGEWGDVIVSGSVCHEDFTDRKTQNGATYRHVGGVFEFFVFQRPA